MARPVDLHQAINNKDIMEIKADIALLLQEAEVMAMVSPSRTDTTDSLLTN